jgi:hypothetical protein
MSLLGNAAIVMWGATKDQRAHDLWHSQEHILERVSLPGFLRGRRCKAVEPGQSFANFYMYEIADVATATSPEYLARLNNPTPRTREIMPSLRLSRTVCQVASSQGIGTGSYMMTCKFSALESRAYGLRLWLGQDCLPSLPATFGVVAAHLLTRDPSQVDVATAEKALRGGHDDVADWIAIVEGYDIQALDEIVKSNFSAANLTKRGATAAPVSQLFQLCHLVSADDVLQAQ